MTALYVVCGKWILYCLFGGQLVQISNGNLKDFKALNFLDFGKISGKIHFCFPPQYIVFSLN